METVAISVHIHRLRQRLSCGQCTRHIAKSISSRRTPRNASTSSDAIPVNEERFRLHRLFSNAACSCLAHRVYVLVHISFSTINHACATNPSGDRRIANTATSWSNLRIRLSSNARYAARSELSPVPNAFCKSLIIVVRKFYVRF